jgi:7-carboxy-7-deazaguanine synthase
MKQYPINETFGPTIQGEGPLAGKRTFFVRFAGCDFDCGWCDSKYAVNPKYPGWSKLMQDTNDIEDSLLSLGLVAGDWIALSGGNPALFVDLEFCEAMGVYKLLMETQGSRIIDSDVLAQLDCLVVSPKPPSSGMSEKMDSRVVYDTVYYRRRTQLTALKYVIFDDVDLDWVIYFDKLVNAPPEVERFLSVGTPLKPSRRFSIQEDDPQGALMDVRWAVCEALELLFERVAKDPKLRDFRVLPQLHVLAYGQKRGV